MHVERNCPFRGYVSWGPPLENQRPKLQANLLIFRHG